MARVLTAELPKVRVEPDLKDALLRIAAKQERDVSFTIRRACRELVEREREDTK